jgi:hypothetical protein
LYNWQAQLILLFLFDHFNYERKIYTNPSQHLVYSFVLCSFWLSLSRTKKICCWLCLIYSEMCQNSTLNVKLTEESPQMFVLVGRIFKTVAKTPAMPWQKLVNRKVYQNDIKSQENDRKIYNLQNIHRNTSTVNTPIIFMFSVFKSMFPLWITQSNAFGWNCQTHCCCLTCVSATFSRTKLAKMSHFVHKFLSTHCLPLGNFWTTNWIRNDCLHY